MENIKLPSEIEDIIFYNNYENFNSLVFLNKKYNYEIQNTLDFKINKNFYILEKEGFFECVKNYIIKDDIGKNIHKHCKEELNDIILDFICWNIVNLEEINSINKKYCILIYKYGIIYKFIDTVKFNLENTNIFRSDYIRIFLDIIFFKNIENELNKESINDLDNLLEHKILDNTKENKLYHILRCMIEKEGENWMNNIDFKYLECYVCDILFWTFDENDIEIKYTIEEKRDIILNMINLYEENKDMLPGDNNNYTFVFENQESYKNTFRIILLRDDVILEKEF